MQLSLSIGLRDDASFENFLPGDNSIAFTLLQSVASGEKPEGSIYLWGGVASGKTHLLQAVCHQATKSDLQVAFIPLSKWREMDVAILEGLENFSLICLDDIDVIAGNKLWEQELFHLYNRIHEKNKQLIVSATSSLQSSTLQLPDLKSRLSWGLVFQLKELSEIEKSQAMQVRAKRRGFELPENVSQYLLKRYSRDMNSLFDLLNELDKASLTAQRRLTVPFVKKWLENKEHEGVLL